MTTRPPVTGLDLAAVLDQALAGVPGPVVAPASRPRQPVHTVYVPADRFGPGLASEWGAQALALMDQCHDASAATFAGLGGDTADLPAPPLLDSVRAKLAQRPVEDVRVDFEDGYGMRSDDEEDAAVDRAVAVLAVEVRGVDAPLRYGIRFKSFEARTRRRAVRTLERFVGGLAACGAVTSGLVVTLPKASSVAEVEAMAAVCAHLEEAYSLQSGTLRFEVQVELPAAVVDAEGRHPAPAMIRAAAGRLVGFHYGTYDYSAACGVAGPFQASDHSVAAFAKAVLVASAAGSGVDVVDGSSNRVPVGTSDEVRRAWADHARLVRAALEGGLYQGWDLHPGQLVSRYAATFAFFRAGLVPTATRLAAYLDRSGSGHLDEPATAAAMTDYLRRAVDCGAVTSDVLASAGGAAVAAHVGAGDG